MIPSRVVLSTLPVSGAPGLLHRSIQIGARQENPAGPVSITARYTGSHQIDDV